MGKNTKLYIGADHAGFTLKERLKYYFTKKGYHIIDLGNTTYSPHDDYPTYGWKVARAVAHTKNSKGILICGSSEGVCIVANKAKGVRAISAFNTKTARLARSHNDSNVLCLSGWYLTFLEAKRIVKTFLQTPFSNEARHRRRIAQITKIEKKR